MTASSAATTAGRSLPSLTLAVLADQAGPRARGRWIQVLELVRSTRRYGGRCADAPFLVLVPEHPAYRDSAIEELVAAAGAELVSFRADDSTLGFPFAAAASAAALAEERAEKASDCLMYFFPDSLVLQDLSELLPGPGIDLCYRPVHIANIGSAWDMPPDAFWSLLYEACGVQGSAPFPMKTCVERATIRPYVNAGSLVVRPRLGLLRTWADRFEAVRDSPELQRFYEDDERYLVFVHQAVLSAVLVASVDHARMRELPEMVNYPRHLHDEYAVGRRPRTLNELCTCRYEHPFEVCDWRHVLPAEGDLADWLEAEQSQLAPLVDAKHKAAWRQHLTELGTRA